MHRAGLQEEEAEEEEEGGGEIARAFRKKRKEEQGWWSPSIPQWSPAALNTHNGSGLKTLSSPRVL